MKVPKVLLLLLLTTLAACTQMNQPKDLGRLQELSEKTGIEMVVIDEAEKITGTQAEHFKRHLIGSSYISVLFNQLSISNTLEQKRFCYLVFLFMLTVHWPSRSLTA